MCWLKRRIQELAGMRPERTENSSDTESNEANTVLTEVEEHSGEHESREDNSQ